MTRRSASLLLTSLLLLVGGIHDAHSQSTLISVPTRRDVVFDHAGRYLYITTSNGSVQRYNLSTSQLDHTYNFGGSLNGLDIARDDSFLLVGQNNLAGGKGIFHKLDLGTGAVTNFQYTPELDEGGGWDVAIDANGLALLTSTGPNWCWVRQLNVATSTITLRQDATAGGSAGGVPQKVYNDVQLRQSADGTRIACYESGLSSRATFIYDISTDKFSPYLRAFNASTSGASLNRDGTLLGTQLNTPSGHTASIDTIPDLHFVYGFQDIDGDVVFDAVKNVLYGVNSSTDQIVAYDTNTLLELFRLNIGENIGPGSVQFGTGTLVASQDGHYLALETASGIRLFTVPQSSPSPSPTPPPSLADRRGMVFDHSGNYLYVSTSTGFVMRYNLATSSTDAAYYLGGSLYGLDIAPNDSFLIVAQGNTGVVEGISQKLDLTTGQVSNLGYLLDVGESGGWDVAIAANGTGFITTQLNGLFGLTPFRQIDFATNTVTALLDFPRFGHYAAVGQNTQIARSANYTRLSFLQPYEYRGPFFTYNAVTNTFDASVFTERDLSSGSVAVNRDGTLLATGFGAYVAVDHAPDLAVKHIFIADGFAFDGATDTFYITRSASDQLIAYDTNTFREKFRLDLGQAISPGVTALGTGTIVASPDGRHVALETPSGIKVFTVFPAPTSANPPALDLSKARDMVFDHSGNHLYITMADGTVLPYNISANAFEPAYDVGALLNGVDIAFDDSYLLVAESAAGLSQTTVEKLDLITGNVTQIAYPHGPSPEIGTWDVAISANGLALVTEEFGGASSPPIHQIDLATNQIRARPDVPPFFAGLNTSVWRTQVHRSADGTRFFFMEPQLPGLSGFTYSSLTNSFSPAASTHAIGDGVTGAVNRDGSLVATRAFNASLATAPDLVFEHTFTLLDNGVAFDAVADILYGVSRSTAQIIAYDTSTFAEMFRLNIGQPMGQDTSHFGAGTLVASQNGRYVALITRTTVRVLDVNARATPTPTPAPTPTSVSGSGMINAAGGAASFSISATKAKKNKWKASFSYGDPAAPLTLTSKKLSGFSVTGNQVQFTGSAKLATKSKATFTVNMTDNGAPGTSDTLSISVSTGYSASGNLTSGDIVIH